MANLNLLTANYHKIHSAIKSFDDGKQNRDNLLKTYNDVIQQTPDYYNSKESNKPSSIRPTTIVAASHNLISATNKADPKLLKIKAKQYVDELHKAHKDGNWILFDYKNLKPVDSSPQAIRNYIGNYQDGLHQDIEKLQQKQLQEKQADVGPEL